jgi:hypothetical protein
MKCQACDGVATNHVTEIRAGQPVEFHVCDAHLQTLDSVQTSPRAPTCHDGLTAFLQAPELAAVLRDKETRKKVVAYLLPTLCLALLDQKPEVRVMAAFRLMALGEDAQSAVGALQDALEDSDERVRQAAKIAMDSIQRKGFLWPL